jgi:CRP-like cAMP-binding protein
MSDEGGDVDAKDLEPVPLFADLSRRERERVARWADDITLPAGEQLLRRGDLPHEFFVLLEGTVEVRRGDDVLATLAPGDFFGEIAIVQDDRRTATVVSMTPVRVAVMNPRDFDEMRHEIPVIASKIQQAAIERMQN